MLKSINVCTYPENVPLADVFAGIKAAGFRYAELNMFSSRQTYPNLWLGADDSEIIAVRELAAEYGITPVGLVSAELWSKRLTDNDPGVRAAGIEVIRRMIHACTLLGADTVLVVPGTVDENTSYRQAYENSLGCMRILAP